MTDQQATRAEGSIEAACPTDPSVRSTIRIGVDFGGTKIEAAALDGSGTFLSRVRVATPATYDAAIDAVCQAIGSAESEAGGRGTIGVGAPGSLSPGSGLMRNANAVYLNGRNFRGDLEQALGRTVRLANDANCLALSETVDGAARGSAVTFALILGTGCGGGLVVNGHIVEGGNGIGGEWGHVPLPWLTEGEFPGTDCWCGQRGCLETWISGTGISRDHLAHTGVRLPGSAIAQAAEDGEAAAAATIDRYVDRLARAIAMLANIVDPETIVLGGGMSNVAALYDRVPQLVSRYTFADCWNGAIVPARWGDSSGVRGAARLWADS